MTQPDYLGKDKIDENRFEQEILFYLEKIDITEEKVRLEQHCNYFLQVLQKNNTSKGRKLSFISQEMGREINTLGSKANQADIQKLVRWVDELYLGEFCQTCQRREYCPDPIDGM